MVERSPRIGSTPGLYRPETLKGSDSFTANHSAIDVSVLDP